MNNKKIMKKNFALALLASAFILISLVSFVSSQEVNYCCEKTRNGAWCMNSPQSDCDPAFKVAPTSCDSTSYCRQGCCFDSQEGLCMESTPQRICSASGGTWANDSKCNVPQCNLGCCIIGDQGAFVTLTRCKQLSGFYGLKTDFRRSIVDEVECIATAQGADKGACVYENAETLAKECVFTTREKCKTAGQTSENITDINETEGVAAPGFYKDILCSAEELGNICGPSTKTMRIDGKDEVYFQDTCGNSANIYDASRYSDKQYWKKVYKKSESCGYGSSNAGSKECGNCDYYLGSIARPATRTTGFPTYGDFICIDLSCKNSGKKHGESWCEADIYSTEDGRDTAGSRYYKEVCLFNEIITEPCADYRNEICIQGSNNGFTEAACRVNRWQSCTAVQEEDDCENEDQRDCFWISGYYFSSSTSRIEKSTNDSNGDGTATDPTVQGLCVPSHPPGLVFWSDSSTSTSTASFNATTSSFGTGYVSPTSSYGASASTRCQLGNIYGVFNWTKQQKPWSLSHTERQGEWTCNNTECKTFVPKNEWSAGNVTDAEAKAWAVDINKICYTLGDCGGYVNWLNVYTDDGFAAYRDNRRIAGSGGPEILTSNTTTTSSSSTAASTTSTSSSASSTASNIASTVSTASNLLGGSSGTSSAISGSVILDFIKKIAGGFD